MNLTFNEKIKFYIFFTFAYIINIFIFFYFNNTNKYILMHNWNQIDNIYIDKMLGFYIFTIVYILIVLVYQYLMFKLRYNYDKSQMYILRVVFLIFLTSITILNVKRNLLLNFNLSDNLVLSLSVLTSYIYFMYKNINMLYRVIKVPFIFVCSENATYIKFQYNYLWTYLYIFILLPFATQMISNNDFYFLIILLFIFDVIIKNSYLYYKNLNFSYNSTLTIIRHGQTEANNTGNIQGWTDNPLNETGKKQAREIQKKISTIFDCYQCSPLIRSYQTLDILTSDLNILPKFQLNEFCIERNFGELENIWRDPHMRNYFEKYDGIINSKRVLNFESNKQLIHRANLFIKDIKKYYRGNNICTVSHSHFIKALLTAVSNDNYFEYKIPNCSISQIEFFKNDACISTTDIENY